MRTFFKRFIARSDGSKQCSREFVQIEEQLNNLGIDASTALIEIKPRIRELLANQDVITSGIKEKNISPRNVVLCFLLAAVRETLPSGLHHIYRGTLSMKGQGLLVIWDYVVNELENSGYYSHEKSGEAKAWIREEIKETG